MTAAPAAEAPGVAAQETRTVLSGNLSRCPPLFTLSSDVVFCACSSTVLGVSVETGEELMRLPGHSKDVTAMLMLPPGKHGADVEAGNNGSERRERLLTASVDGTLRLWDVSADLMSFEGEAERCLRVLTVGMPVYHLFLGRRDSHGAALDVIIVTKEEPSSSLHGLSDSNKTGDGNPASPLRKSLRGSAPAVSDVSDDPDEAGSDEEESGDDSSDSERGSGAGGVKGVIPARKKEGSGGGEGASGWRRRKGGKSNRWLHDWQVVRYGLKKGKAEAILQTCRGRHRWVGTVAPRSPLPPSGSGGGGGEDGFTRGGTWICPVVLSADGRVVIAVDAGTGEKALLVRATGAVCSLAVGGGGDLLVTGHVDGSMSQWHALPERLGAAFRVSGFEEKGGEPSTDMHWHAHPVRCMGVAADGVQLFSGAEEAVLVQWNLNKGTKAFLPRIGAALTGLAVSPGQEYLLVISADNAATLVGLAEWDVMWQMRGLALSRPPLPTKGAGLLAAGCKALELTMGPRPGLVACNGRAGHVQFYNIATDCLEASAEIVRANRDTSAKVFHTRRGGRDSAKNAATAAAAAAASTGTLVEHVAFSSDGKRMVAVASRLCSPGAPASPSLSFWTHARGSNPYDAGSYTGSYAGARGGGGGSGVEARKTGIGRGGSGGTSGHWAEDTSVESPHGRGIAVSALEYHPRRDVAVTAAWEGGFCLWGLRRSDVAVKSLAADAGAMGRGARGKGEDGEGEVATHWACTLSARYKEGLSATGVSFCSDGSVLAVSYTSEIQGGGQGVITLWSLETITLLATLLPPRTRDVRPGSIPRNSLGFIPRSGRIFASGSGYAAVWDMVSAEPTPLWEYRANVLAAATADPTSVFRACKAGISVKGRGVGDVALCVDAASLKGGGTSGRKRGSVVLLLNSAEATPLHSWRLPHDTPTCLRLLLSTNGSGGREGVLCLTARGELLLLSVASGAAGDGGVPAPGSRVVGEGGLGVLRIKPGASAPAVHIATVAKRQLLDVDLSISDPALVEGRKRARAAGDGSDGEENDGHAGGREGALRSGHRAADILDPSTINLAPVPDLYEAFMKTLLKPAPRAPHSKPNINATLPGRDAVGSRGAHGALSGGLGKASAGREGGGANAGVGRGKMGSGGGRGGAGDWGGKELPAMVVDQGLLEVLTKRLKDVESSG